MTTTDTDAVLAGAAAVIRCLPVADIAPGEAVSGAEALSGATPGPGAKAVSATLSGAMNGTLLIVLSAELASQVENGPVGQQELVAGLSTALDDAVTAMSASFGATSQVSAQGLDAEVALANAADNDTVVVVPFANAAGPAGSLVLLLSGVQGGAADGANFETLSESLVASGSLRGVELLSDVEMGVTVELGRTRMTVKELLGLQPGAIVELDRAAGSPVDLLVNGTLVARGEVVVIDEEFGVRITEIVGYDSNNKLSGQ